jgi:hypothetical protein
MQFQDVPPGFLPPGFLSIDLARTLKFKLFDANGFEVKLSDGFCPKQVGGFLATDPAKPRVIVVSNGGSDLIYLPDTADTDLAAEHYTGSIFVNGQLGAIGLAGTAVTPPPSIMVSFMSFPTGCPNPEIRGAESETPSFSKAKASMVRSAARIHTISWPPSVPTSRSGFAIRLPWGTPISPRP